MRQCLARRPKSSPKLLAQDQEERAPGGEERRAPRAHLGAPAGPAHCGRGSGDPRSPGTPYAQLPAQEEMHRETPTRARRSSPYPRGPDSPRTFFSASSPPAGAEEAGAVGPVAAGAASPPGFPATRAAGAGAAAWGAPPPTGLLGAGSRGAAGAASAGACGRVVVVLVVLASPASLMPPPLLSLGHLGGGWSAVSAAGGRGGRARSRGGRCGSRGAGGGGRGGVSRRRRLELSGCALALGLLARSYCPKNGPAQVFLGGARAGEGRAGEGRGWGKLASELGTDFISI